MSGDLVNLQWITFRRQFAAWNGIVKRGAGNSAEGYDLYTGCERSSGSLRRLRTAQAPAQVVKPQLAPSSSWLLDPLHFSAKTF